MKILFVTQFFYPENFRINDLAKRLHDRGHEVCVLTGIPNYPEGRFYDGYGLFGKKGNAGKSASFEDINGIRIYRTPVIPRGSGSVSLCLNYLSFVISGCLRALFFEEKDFDVIYAFGTSPITQALPALFLKKLTGKKVILNVQDLWPDNVTAITGLKDPFGLFLLDELVDRIYNGCDVILGTSRSFVRAIKGRKGLKEKRKVGFWPQYSVVERSSEKRRDLMREGCFHIAFTGNVGYGQGLDLVIRSAAHLREDFKGRLVFDIFGDGRAREELEGMVRSLSLGDMVVFHGSFPEEEIPAILNTADAALLILKDDPIFTRTIPAKLQTYLSCSCPVLACARGETERLVRGFGVGICAEDMNEASFERAVRTMMEAPPEELDKMRERALSLSGQMFDADRLIDELVGYMKLLSC